MYPQVYNMHPLHIPKKLYMHIITIHYNPPKCLYNSLSLRSHSTTAGARGLENKLE
jgi:hypothetical protein